MNGLNGLKLIAAAALLGLPLAACDEATPPAPTGSIGGQVAIEGTGIDGVSVNLSNGSSATTSGGGNYRFDNVEGGAYTVTISGYPSDATFDRTSAAATISTAGQSVTVNFSGTYVRTASVLGAVTIEGGGVGGVEVTLSGGPDGAANATTDGGGRYAFTGLRAGSYAVEISGFDSDEVGFSATAQNVAVAVGESKVVSFDGTYLRTAGISGQVSVDGVGIADVTVSLTGGPDAADMTVATDAGGQYAFAKLRGGEYRVGISGYDSDEYEFEATSRSVTVALGETANVPFEGTLVRTAGISGRVSAGGTGLAGVTVSLTGPDSATYTTDQSGQYAFPALPAGAYALAVSGYDADEYGFDDDEKSQTVTVEDGQTAIVNFEGHLLRNGSISGRVTVDGAGMAGVTVTLSAEGRDDQTRATDDAGAYSFTMLAAGDYAVAVSGYDTDEYGFDDGTSMTVTLARDGDGVGSGTADFMGAALRTGSISGRVTVGGAGMAGVTVTLSGADDGTAETDDLGQYSFEKLPAGDYTVAVSGYDMDEYDFGDASMKVKLERGGMKDDADFAGAALRTGSVSGRVSVGDTRLPGVVVALTGADDRSDTTDAQGEYSFERLKAGEYAVTVSGYDSVAYVFDETSMDVELADGAAGTANFEGAHTRTASVSGRLYLDSNAQDDAYSAGAEDFFMHAGFPVALQGPGVNDEQTVKTDATGAYEFSGLRAGTYRVVPQATDSVRAMLKKAGLAYNGDLTGTTVEVAAGASGTVHVPIDIVRQTITFGAVMGNGKEGKAAKTGGPVAGVKLKLYATYQDATADANELCDMVTDSTGMVEFDFARKDDADMFVFAKVTGTPAGYALTSNETMEIRYGSRKQVHAAGTPVTLVNTKVTLQFGVKSVMTKRGGGKALAGWKSSYVVGKDTAAFGTSDAKGMAKLAFTTPKDSLPRTYSVVLDAKQAQAMGEMFEAARMPSDMADAGAMRLSYTHDGLNTGAAAVDLGMYEVKFTTQTLIVGAHWERDQTEGYTKNLLDGDRAGVAGAVSVELLYEDDRRRLQKYEIKDSAEAKLGNPRSTDKNGMVTFRRLPADVKFTVEATGLGGRKVVGVDEWDTYGAVLDDGKSLGAFGAESGTGPQVRLCPLGMGAAGKDCSTFGYLWSNNVVWGAVGSVEYGGPNGNAASPARPLNCVGNVGSTVTVFRQCYTEAQVPDIEVNGLKVKLVPNGDDLEPANQMTATVGGTWNARTRSWSDSGVYVFQGVQSGRYTVMVEGNSDWQPFLPAKAPSFHLLQSADMDSTRVGGNTTLHRAARHQTFRVKYRKTSISGTVANDREVTLGGTSSDFNGVVDPGETMEGVEVTLLGGSGFKTVMGKAKTDRRGVYKFSNLVEGLYKVRGDSTPDYALYARSIRVRQSAQGDTHYLGGNVTDTLETDARPATRDVTTAKAGAHFGSTLPRWTYYAHGSPINGAGQKGDPDLVILFKTNTITGTVWNDPASGADTAMAGVEVWLDRCRSSQSSRVCWPGAYSPRLVATTDANGKYEFTGLLEGMYFIEVVVPNNWTFLRSVGRDQDNNQSRGLVKRWGLIGSNQIHNVNFYIRRAG